MRKTTVSQRDTSSIRNLLIGIVIFIGIILPIASIVNKLVTAEFKLQERESQVSNTKDVEKVVLISKPKVENVSATTMTDENRVIASKLGKEVYDKACTSCHTNGLAGAPKFADKDSWIERVTKGEDTLINSAINGINVMPPRGGRSDLTDNEVKAAVQYMLLAIDDKTSIAESAPVQPIVTKSVAKPSVTLSSKSTNGPKSGKEVYTMSCITCHGEGVVGSPKIGDRTSWQPRIAKGESALVTSVINGLNIMPPRGGNNSLTDEEIKLAVQFILKAVANPTPSQIVSPSKTAKPVMLGNARMSGKETYDTSCASCHVVGIAKAPRFGNKDDWKPRIAKGKSALISSVINGFNVMPPRGGNNNLNDAEIKSAVQYMLQAVGK
ncbi:c-type cytochrome [Candidatus Halobeggiatoa sp. HSG11]|nr:c-type cytochrome [Candidatus Halobeggiatoa sp. HSG11]